MDAADFPDIGLTTTIGTRSIKFEKLARGRFASSYGTEPIIVAILWAMMMQSNSSSSHDNKPYPPKHLLCWAPMFLKSYDTEMNIASRLRVPDEKTYRKWLWIILPWIATP
jgi:hypothetical protein